MSSGVPPVVETPLVKWLPRYVALFGSTTSRSRSLISVDAAPSAAAGSNQASVARNSMPAATFAIVYSLTSPVSRPAAFVRSKMRRRRLSSPFGIVFLNQRLPSSHSRPQPVSRLGQFVGCSGFVPFSSTAFMTSPLGLYVSAGVASPRGYQPSTKNCRASTALPVTVGAAIDVPESDAVSGACGVVLTFVEPRAEIVLVPGAMMSGFWRRSAVSPRLEKLATVVEPACPSAPTVSAFFALPGEPMVPTGLVGGDGGPSLPEIGRA